ncbi:MAG: hypothetical protein ACOX4Q_09125 [Syntrophomonadales bacterium]|jgi:hypothetical protein
MKRWTEEKMIEKAVDTVFEYAQKPANPYSYLYHNPRAIHTPQYFAHWTQKWQNHRVYMTLVRAAKVTGYEPVPSILLHRNAKRDGYGDRSVQVGQLAFYLIKPEEMSPALRRRYYAFKDMLFDDIRQNIRDHYEGKEKEKALRLFSDDAPNTGA